MPFNRYAGGRDPAASLKSVPYLVEHLLQGPSIRSGFDEDPYRLIEGFSRILRGGSRTHYIERHGVSQELIAFLPDLDGVINEH